MNDLAFDTLSRFVAGAIPHRAQDREQGATRPGPREPSVTAEASKDTCRKKAERRCKKQVASCITGLTSRCNGNSVCLAKTQQCCPLLESCDATKFLDCFLF